MSSPGSPTNDTRSFFFRSLCLIDICTVGSKRQQRRPIRVTSVRLLTINHRQRDAAIRFTRKMLSDRCYILLQ